MIRKHISILLELQKIFQLQKITTIIRLNHQALDACLSQFIIGTINARLESRGFTKRLVQRESHELLKEVLPT